MVIALLAGSLSGIICLAVAFHVSRRRQLIAELPTSKTQGVFIGQVEVKGTAESEAPLVTYLAGERAVLYRWEVTENWSRTVPETYRDAQGHMQTRMRTESGWKQVAAGSEMPPFYLKDDTGVVRIVPDGAEIQAIATFDQTVRPSDALYYAKGPDGSIPDSTHRRRFSENAIPLHAALYVTGQARERQDIVAAELAADKKCPFFLISTRSETQLNSTYNRWFWFWLIFGLILALGAVALQAAFGLVLAALQFILAAGIYLLLFAALWLFHTYNRLVKMRNRTRQARSQVDVQLKRRHDLIPNLIQAVQGFRQHETGLQSLLAELRQESTRSAGGRALAPQLVAVAEKYPELKAGSNFLRLQQELAATEQRIALSRAYFNDVTTYYNTRLDVVPDRFVGRLLGFRSQELLAAADFERAPVRVNLAD